MKISIREAENKDAKAITELSGQLGYKTNEKETQFRISEILKNTENRIYVAVNDKKIVGWVHAFYTLRVESDFFVEIGGLVVHEDFHKNGIGKKLVEQVFNWSKNKKCSVVRVRCNVVRTKSHKFYEKIGFRLKKEQKVFVKAID